MSQKSAWRKPAKIIVVLLFVGLLVYGYLSYGKEHLTAENIEIFVNQFGVFAPVVFGIMYIIGITFLFQAVLFSILAGVLFGTLQGSIIVIISATLASALCFWATRSYGVEITSWIEQGTLKSLVSKVNGEVEENGFLSFFILRCVQTPYIPLSLAAGLVRKAKFKDFILATFITNCIFSPIVVYFGSNITAGPKALILPVALIIASIVISKLVKKYTQKKKA
jgi:uncharacterized membrane protein YdjX (TVP38/TMEM64 family)